jgi:hypothetical protein
VERVRWFAPAFVRTPPGGPLDTHHPSVKEPLPAGQLEEAPFVSQPGKHGCTIEKTKGARSHEARRCRHRPLQVVYVGQAEMAHCPVELLARKSVGRCGVRMQVGDTRRVCLLELERLIRQGCRDAEMPRCPLR